MKKAQITMETLLLYGLVVLIVLLAVGALMYFGVLDLGGLLPEKCNLEATGIMKCEEWKVDSGASTVSLTVVNTGAKSLVVQGASFTPKDSALVSGCTTLPAAVTILPGSKALVTITGCTINVEVGKRINGKLTLNTMFSDGLLDQDTVGDFIATVS